MIRKDAIVAVVVTFCLATALFAIRGYGAYWPYNPWWDINDDGKIDIQDLARVSGAFGTYGTPLTKAGLIYDSDWLNITDKRGQSITVTHNLNIADWNNPNITVDITGKTTPTTGLFRFLGLTGQQGWNKTYGGTNEDYLTSVVQTGDGGYALAGFTKSFGAGSYDFWLVGTDAFGNMLWNKTYGGTGDDEASSLVQTSDGGYALAGATKSFGSGSGDFWLVKTDENGIMQWNKTYGGINYETGGPLVQTTDGGYAMAGTTNSFGHGEYDFWFVKADENGIMQWNNTYGGPWNEQPWALVQTTDGGYALAGDTVSFGVGIADFWLVKTDSAGNISWSKNYGGAGIDYAYALVQTTDGGYALAGDTTSFGAGSYDFWLVKTYANGTMQWSRTYGGTGHDVAGSVVQTSDGGYALAGVTTSFGSGSGDFWLVKTDENGIMQWNKTYGGTSNDSTGSVVQTSDGGYALVGITTSFGAGNEDAWLVKTDADGKIGGSGLVWVGSTSNTIILYRGATDPCWNYVRVQIWKRK